MYYFCLVINRQLENNIIKLLRQFPAVAILGPRQVGKTTLAKQIAASGKKSMLYLDMEKPADRNRLKDAHTYLTTYKSSCVIIDEAQLLPHLFSELRPLIDEYRKPGRFILLGSASPNLVKGVSVFVKRPEAALTIPKVSAFTNSNLDKITDSFMQH